MDHSPRDAARPPAHHHDAPFWVQPEEAEVDVSALDFPPGIFTVAELPKFSPAPGVEMSVLAGKGAMANWVRIEPNGSVPMHSHPHEQLGMVIEGAITMVIGNKEQTLVPGHCYRIPGTLPHAAVAGPQGCLVLDIFSPLREEYVAAAK